MHKEKKLSRSIRKFIRKEKSRIYREIFDLEKRKKAIEEIYKK
jgi:hypothetical protein